jgi:hypothetical protein
LKTPAPPQRAVRVPFTSGQSGTQHVTQRQAVADRAGLNSEKFDLKTFRSTYATRMLRSGFDVRTVQHWMGHQSLETTMRDLVPASDVHDRLDQVGVPSLLRHRSLKETRSTGSRRQQKTRSLAQLIQQRLVPLDGGSNRKNVLGAICFA